MNKKQREINRAEHYTKDRPVSCKQCFFWLPSENKCLLQIVGEPCHYLMPAGRMSNQLNCSTCQHCPYKDKETDPHKRQPCVDLCTWKYTKWLSAIAKYRSMREKVLIRQRIEQRTMIGNESE